VEQEREAELLATWGRLERNADFARLESDELATNIEFSARTTDQLRAAKRWLDRNQPELTELAITIGLLRAAPDAIAVSDPHLQGSLTTARVLDEAYEAEATPAGQRR
jgi:hypothetical protein